MKTVIIQVAIFFLLYQHEVLSFTQTLHHRPTINNSNINDRISPVIPSHKQKHTILFAESPDKKKAQGVYARPSAAIEKGSGFYVPGLEGSRVRILFGIIVLVLTYVNTLLGLGDSSAEAVAFSQNLVVFYGTLLLFQGFVEFGKENGLGLEDNISAEKRGSAAADAVKERASTSARQLDQKIQGGLRDDEVMAEKVRWVGASFIALTAATHIVLLEECNGNAEILYSLGDSFPDDDGGAEIGIQAAIDTVYGSKGGRVSVPSSHPCAVLLPEDSRRCILLQQVEINGKRRCLMVGSDQLLAAFTSNDLKWLGSLGDYLC